LDAMDDRLVSIFDDEMPEHLRKESLRDLVKLAGVVTELRDCFEEPLKVLEILKVLNLIQQEALGLDEPLVDDEALFYRYRNRYGREPGIALERLLNVLQKYHWIIRTKRRLTMMDVGKRMMDMLIRLANDSLAFYMRDEVARLLYQAGRDADLSEAYDDKGISGGNRLASMIRNVEDAVAQLRERQLEFLADRHALPQIETIMALMEQLDLRMKERLSKYETFEQGAEFAPLLKKGTQVMMEGLHIAAGTLNKFLRFNQLQQTDSISEISPHHIRRFIIQSFHKKEGSDQLDGREILSFMEQDQDVGERLDGMWMPVQFAAPLPSSQITNAIRYLENYEPATEPIVPGPQPQYASAEEVSEAQAQLRLEEVKWRIAKDEIPTEAVESVLEQGEFVPLPTLLLQAGSDEWADAVNAMLAVSALVGAGKAQIRQTNQEDHTQVKGWEIIDGRDRRKQVGMGETGGGDGSDKLRPVSGDDAGIESRIKPG